jgi:hypothetical protein
VFNAVRVEHIVFVECGITVQRNPDTTFPPVLGMYTPGVGTQQLEYRAYGRVTGFF